ncbi:MAG: TonB-dependent receptor, partial [Calditrichaeota bacterium]|nr:TonB-dependent receptor [Calditrichota bacterium]
STDNYGSNLMWPDQSRALEVAPEAIGDHIRSEKLHAAFQWRKVQSRNLAFRLRLSSFANNWTDYFHDSHDYSRARTFGAEFQTDYLLANRHPLTVGFETRFDRVRANIFGRRKAKDLASYVQLEWHFSSRWLANLGVRQDFHWRDGMSVERQLSPKLGVVWHYLPTGTFRAAVGSGFRAASIAEAYSQTFVSGIQVRPNPDLKAERGWTAELGVTQRVGNLSASASLFYDRFHDLIEPQADVTNTVRFANVTEARLQGSEIGVQGATHVLQGTARFSVNYVYLDTRDLTLDEPLAYRARHTLQNSLSWSRGRWTFGLDYRYVSRIERVQIYWRDERVPQKVLDLRASLATGVGVFTFEVDNALNYAYTQIERNLQPIRSFRLSYRARL